MDVDDLWAIADCYCLDLPAKWEHFVITDALPRAMRVFKEAGILATFFLVGRDIEDPECADIFHRVISGGHYIGNHSYSHSLAFRLLTREAIQSEVQKCDTLCREVLGTAPVGFRAPGYGWSNQLIQALTETGYDHDSSLMPSFVGPALRYMDARLTRQAQQEKLHGQNGSVEEQRKPGHTRKSQYPLMSDGLRKLRPFKIGSVTEHPVAVSPVLRLPMQAGVCMSLGQVYFRMQEMLASHAYSGPITFLFHAADFADFSQVPVPFFKQSRFFSSPVEKRMELARLFLEQWQNSIGISDKPWA